MKHPHLATIARTLGVGAVLLLGGCTLEVLSPKGDIGAQEKTLILTALGLMLIVVVPVILMTLYFVWKYREGSVHAQREYAPKWSHSNAIEAVVWTVPCIIVAILAVLTWKSSHALDPYRPIESDVKPVNIDVVSLDWKWLFIYPDYDIATVNEIVFPVDAPVQFRITSASVMNSFFIPQLGSQIYSMAGMETKLHLIAREAGSYDGLSANYSGAGFSGMRFKAIATTDQASRLDRQDPRHQQPADAPGLRRSGQAERAHAGDLYSTAPTGMFDFIMHNQMSKLAGVDPFNCTPATKNLIATAE